MYHQSHCVFYNDFAYDTVYQGLAKSCDEGQRMAKVLGKKSVLFMANHGVLLVAPNVPIAFDNAYFLERACMTQVHLRVFLPFLFFKPFTPERARYKTE